MNISLPLAQDILSTPGKILLSGSFGISLILAMKRGGLSESFERLAIGFFVILFYGTAMQFLYKLGVELDEFFQKLGNVEALDQYLAKGLYQSATGTQNSAWNFANYNMQIFRFGIWGVCASIVGFLYMVVRLILEVSRDALWQILFILLPMGAAVYPLFPKILGGLVRLAIELVLWHPLLTIVNITTGLLAREYAKDPNDIGFRMLTCQIISIILTLTIPAFVHKIVTGAVSGDILGPWERTFAVAASYYARGTSVLRLGKKLLPIIALCFFFAQTAHAENSLHLAPGFITKITCRGRLLISSIGNPRLVELEALPKELGCGVLLKPLIQSGETNLILETSAGSINQILEIVKTSKPHLAITLEAQK